MDKAPWPLLAVVAGVVLLFLLWLLTRPRRPPAMPFTRRQSLTTVGELRFYKVLLRAAPDSLAVFVKVRLLDVLAVADNAWQPYGAAAAYLHVDFVLADAVTAEPRLVIELDGRSHTRPDARRRDALKDVALAAAGLPLLRVAAAARYDTGKLSGIIAHALASGS
jgi:hypothetical protein